MNQKYKNIGSNVLVYDELDNKLERKIEGDIEKTLKQENIIEILENIICEEQNKLVKNKTKLKNKIINFKVFFTSIIILSGVVANILLLFPLTILRAIILFPIISFILAGSIISTVNYITIKSEYKIDKKKTLQKIIYCQKRKEIELKKLEQLTKEKSQNKENINQEKKLYTKDTIKKIERDVQNNSSNIMVPKRKILRIR